jgi:RecA-family ATPase
VPPISGPQDFNFPPEDADLNEPPPADTPLPFIDMSDWDTVPVPEREWAVRDRIPLRQVSLFSGEGSIGKSVALLQLSAAHVLFIASHPSLTGINTGTGLSGSTAWHNSVRSRMYFKAATTEAGEEPDPELRELQFLKNNYGPKAEKILLRWKSGAFVPANVMGSLDKMAADQNTERVFLKLLGKFNNQNRDISPEPSKIYAPTLFATDPEASGIKVKAFEQAMSRLLDANKIHIVSEGPPSRSRPRLVVGAADDRF